MFFTTFRSIIAYHFWILPLKVLTEISTFLDIDCSKLAKGAIIGIACLYDVKKYTSKEDFLADKVHLSDNFSNPKYGFLLKDAKKLNEPIPVLGRLGFFNVHGSDS